MKCRLGTASWRMVAMAMLEVAPNTNTREGKRGSRSGTTRYPLPEVGAESRVDVGSPLLPLGIELLKVGGAHTGVFGRIHAPGEVCCDAGEAIQKIEGHFPPDGKIKRQGDAGERERHHSGRDRIAKD